MCLCYLFSAKTALVNQLVNRKADFLQNESIRTDFLQNESIRIDSNRELECSTADSTQAPTNCMRKCWN